MSEVYGILIPVNERFVEKVVNISNACRLSPWSVTDYIAEINRPDSFNLIFLEANKENVIGFLFARLIKNSFITTQTLKDQDLHDVKSIREFSEAEIISIGVDPCYQKKGIGQIIFKQFLNFSHENKIKTIWLEVRESNINAQRFYVKNNFKISHRRKNYYSDPFEDAIVMKLHITPLLNEK